jgi:nucleotide-binding universal stress UspA family protein
MFKKILVPLDGSELAERALKPASVLAKTYDAQLLLFRVEPPVPVRAHFADLPPSVYEEVAATARLQARTYLKEVQDTVMDVCVKTRHVPSGDRVADKIVDFAKTADVDLIVMSTHGRTGFDRLVHGSVTEKVLRTLPCATMVIPTCVDLQEEED